MREKRKVMNDIERRRMEEKTNTQMRELNKEGGKEGAMNDKERKKKKMEELMYR